MLKVGLTGSIAVGKTCVCGVFDELGCFVLDADQTARDVVGSNTIGLRLIVDNIGKEVLSENGELDRVKLAEIVFNDESKRQLLNSIVHPLVIEAQDKWLGQKEKLAPKGIALVDAALMIESGSYKRFDKLIVVWCGSDLQLKRLMLRDSLSREESLKRIKSQFSQEEKKLYADFLINTTDGFESTRGQTEQIYQRLKTLV